MWASASSSRSSHRAGADPTSPRTASRCWAASSWATARTAAAGPPGGGHDLIGIGQGDGGHQVVRDLAHGPVAAHALERAGDVEVHATLRCRGQVVYHRA